MTSVTAARNASVQVEGLQKDHLRIAGLQQSRGKLAQCR